ncbi:MAG TPA: PfkB family carbohydrate kinase [Ktedonobacteraceae bacterium]|nr:PfkB family carbohydrate kinase [Ktedonobacteraceae bacterium]
MGMDYDSKGGGKPRPTTIPRVIVVGNLTIDDVVLPDGTTRMSSVGGNSLYTALGVRLWQPRVGLVTRRGEDFPRDLTSVLQSLGVATGGIVDIAGPTVRNWVVYENNGDRHWIYRTPRERSREVAVQPEDLPVAWLAAEPPPVVHVTAMPLEAAEAIVDTVRRVSPRAIITLDTHEDYVVDYRQRLRELAARVDAFLPSRAELADLVGYDDPRRALSTLTSLPTPVIVVKMGAEGALVWDKAQGTLHAVGIAPGPVVDVTGAGDAFCGGFAAGLSFGCSPLESAQRGAISASYAVADFGSLQLARVDPMGMDGLADAMGTDAIYRVPTSAVPIAPASTFTQPPVPGADRGISSAVDMMREEIAMIPRLLTEQHETLAGALHALAAGLTSEGIEHLYLVGCGDSAFAGAATALAFQKHAGIRAEGVHALEFARYRVRYLAQRSAVVCISFSGKVGRTIEAAMQARRFGHRVIVITGNPNSPLAQQAHDVITLSVPTPGYSPGTSTYLAILAALLDLALAWGKARGRDTSSQERLLRDAPELARQTLAEADQPMQRMAEQFVKQPWLTFLGAGPNLATAHFGAAKMFEGPQKLGVATNIEEWAHEEYFVSGAGTPVFLIAPSGASFDRATEILSELTFIGAHPVFISDRKLAQEHSTFIPLAPGLPEEFSPLLAALPLSLFAFHLSRASGQERFEFASPEVAREHYETIHRATQGEPA